MFPLYMGRTDPSVRLSPHRKVHFSCGLSWHTNTVHYSSVKSAPRIFNIHMPCNACNPSLLINPMSLGMPMGAKEDPQGSKYHHCISREICIECVVWNPQECAANPGKVHLRYMLCARNSFLVHKPDTASQDAQREEGGEIAAAHKVDTHSQYGQREPTQ